VIGEVIFVWDLFGSFAAQEEREVKYLLEGSNVRILKKIAQNFPNLKTFTIK
jgi:hypothetical protein